MDLDVQSYSLGHLGIVAGIFDTLKIGEVIDEVMPKQGSKNLPHSTIIKAMILNGLGFTHQRLYLFLNEYPAACCGWDGQETDLRKTAYLHLDD